MPNRAERRAQEKRNRRGIPQQYDQTRGRGRSGMIDEYALQQKSIRLQEGTDGEWKPTASFETPEMTADTDIALRNPKLVKAPHSVRQWFRVLSWALIVIAAIAFVVVMWLPTKPIWLVAGVAVVFAVGVLSLFFTAGNSKHNPNLDANGTAVDASEPSATISDRLRRTSHTRSSEAIDVIRHQPSGAYSMTWVDVHQHVNRAAFGQVRRSREREMPRLAVGMGLGDDIAQVRVRLRRGIGGMELKRYAVDIQTVDCIIFSHTVM